MSTYTYSIGLEYPIGYAAIKYITAPSPTIALALVKYIVPPFTHIVNIRETGTSHIPSN